MDELISGQAIVPQIWFYEVTNTLYVGEKRKRIGRTQSLGVLERLQQLSIILDDIKTKASMAELLNLAGNYKLSVYDAAYLELAVRLKLPLATNDKALQLAAKSTGIKLLEPN